MFLDKGSFSFSRDKLESLRNTQVAFNKSAKCLSLMKNSTFKNQGFEKILWKDTQVIVQKGKEYCCKIIESEAIKMQKNDLKKERMVVQNQMIENIRDEEFCDLSLKISKMNEEFFKQVKKLEKEAYFKLNQEKLTLLSNIQKSKSEALNSIHIKSTKLISSLFPSSSDPTTSISHPRRNSFSYSKATLRKSFEALSQSSKKVSKIKSRLSKNI
jgi:hypothetical protein